MRKGDKMANNSTLLNPYRTAPQTSPLELKAIELSKELRATVREEPVQNRLAHYDRIVEALLKEAGYEKVCHHHSLGCYNYDFNGDPEYCDKYLQKDSYLILLRRTIRGGNPNYKRWNIHNGSWPIYTSDLYVSPTIGTIMEDIRKLPHFKRFYTPRKQEEKYPYIIKRFKQQSLKVHVADALVAAVCRTKH